MSGPSPVDPRAQLAEDREAQRERVLRDVRRWAPFDKPYPGARSPWAEVKEEKKRKRQEDRDIAALERTWTKVLADSS